MSLEIEVLDQLQGGDLPLAVVCGLFPDEAHARRAIGALLAVGAVTLRDGDGQEVRPWQVRVLATQAASWTADRRHRLALADGEPHSSRP